MIITVSKKDFRQALTATVPLIHKDWPKLDMVHAYVVGELLYVQGTDGQAAGLAIVNVWDQEGITGSPRDDSFTLTKHQVAEILTVFKLTKEEAEDNTDNALADPLEITTWKEEIHFKDMAGLIPGKELVIPIAERVQDFPIVPVSVMPQEGVTVLGRATMPSGVVKAFLAAAQTYGKDLTFKRAANDRTVFVACGESFRGSILLRDESRDNDELKKVLDEQEEAWAHRLPVVVEALRPVEQAA